MTTSDGNGGMQSEINVTPMIDVLLVLLIIFMVIVPMIPRGESAVLPRTATHRQPASPDAVVLEVLQGNPGQPAFRINQQPVSRQDLPGRLAAIFANRADRALFVKGDGQLSFSEIAEAIDLGHAAGADRVGILTPGATSGL